MNNFSVIKRDGSRVDFEIQRIINAIKKAASAVNIYDEFYF
ncbi:ATP cone domain-containing protein, partial [Rodentibacter caecimuris]